MELKIDKSRSNSYYGEVLAVMSDYNKLMDNPRQKIRGLTSQAIILIAISIGFSGNIFNTIFEGHELYSLFFCGCNLCNCICFGNNLLFSDS
ncbi:hypothetical protein [Methanobrevibacter sp.]|uniref:hypothetical protein n=1 Tax=Methanobrevibacter sp. TaxID=66852 RepID=UPI0038903393